MKIFRCLDTYTFSSFTSPSIDIWMVFLFLATRNNTVVNIHVQISVWTYIVVSFGYTPRIGIAGSCDNSLFHLWRKSQAVFQSAHVTFCSHKPCVRLLLLTPFVHFSIVLFAFLLLSCKSASYMLETSPLSDTWFASNFSYSMSCTSLS